MGKSFDSINSNCPQQYTSADTSINRSKMPRIYKLVADRLSETDRVIDYGCGKYFDEYNLPANFVGWDPYNYNTNKNVLNKEYDVALCSNVLNVVKEREVRREILEALKSLARKIFITVYEGDGDRKSRPTKRDCYQLHWKRGDYIPELVDVFGAGNVRYNKKGYFECVGGVV